MFNIPPDELVIDIKCINMSKQYLKKDKCILFDVGTNEGNYIDLFKNLINIDLEIHCFEPNNFVFEKLKNKFIDQNFKLNNFGLSNIQEQKNFYFPGNLTVLGSVFNRQVFIDKRFGNTNSITANFITLDSYIDNNKIENIDYLKIDTEGNEFNVLKGAVSSFANKKIICGQIEYGACYRDANTRLFDIYQFLNNHDYILYDVEKERFLKEEDASVDDYRLTNYFFCKK